MVSGRTAEGERSEKGRKGQREENAFRLRRVQREKRRGDARSGAGGSQGETGRGNGGGGEGARGKRRVSDTRKKDLTESHNAGGKAQTKRYLTKGEITSTFMSLGKQQSEEKQSKGDGCELTRGSRGRRSGRTAKRSCRRAANPAGRARVRRRMPREHVVRKARRYTTRTGQVEP